MRAFICPKRLSFGVLLVTIASQVHCSFTDETPRRLPGGGIADAHMSRGDGGAGGSGGTGADVADVADGEGVRSGACEPDGARRRCTAKGPAGCPEGEQTCVAGTWSDCLYTPRSSSD